MDQINIFFQSNVYQPHHKLTSYHLLVGVWQELLTLNYIEITSDAEKQHPSESTRGQTLRHCIQLQCSRDRSQ